MLCISKQELTSVTLILHEGEPQENTAPACKSWFGVVTPDPNALTHTPVPADCLWVFVPGLLDTRRVPNSYHIFRWLNKNPRISHRAETRSTAATSGHPGTGCSSQLTHPWHPRGLADPSSTPQALITQSSSFQLPNMRQLQWSH